MENLLVVKIGGNILDDDKALNKFLADFASIPGNKLLVHGGGKLATELSSKLGIETTMVEGRRITDEDTIKIVTMTYAGWLNKSLVASLQALGSNAIGLCGADAKLIPAKKRPVNEIDYGWVGDILEDNINIGFLSSLFDSGYTPVIAPIASDETGHLLNINADTIAQALAQALSKFYNTTLIYCFEKNGLLMDVDNSQSLIEAINQQKAEQLKVQGVISKGMIPKIDNALHAAQLGVQHIVIGHAAFIKQMAQKQKGYGTYISI